jgi:hypothetical protein
LFFRSSDSCVSVSQFETSENARKAMDGLQGKEFEGQALSIEVAKPKGRSSRGGGGGGYDRYADDY